MTKPSEQTTLIYCPKCRATHMAVLDCERVRKEAAVRAARWAGLDLSALKAAHQAAVKRRDALRQEMLAAGDEALTIQREIANRKGWPRHG